MLAAIQTTNSRGGIAQTRVVALPPGRAGTSRTLQLIVADARRSMMLPAIRSAALGMLADVRERDYAGEATAVQRAVRQRIRYVRDPAGREVLQSALLTLQSAQGDCDDQTALVMALLGSVGHTMRATAIGMSAGRFHHVYAETLIGGAWLPVETTEDWPVGYTPPGIVEHMSLSISPPRGALFGFKKSIKKAGKKVGHAAKRVSKAVAPIAKVAAIATANVYAPGSGVLVGAALTGKKRGRAPAATLTPRSPDAATLKELSRLSTQFAPPETFRQPVAERMQSSPDSGPGLGQQLSEFYDKNKTAVQLGGGGLLAVMLLRSLMGSPGARRR